MWNLKKPMKKRSRNRVTDTENKGVVVIGGRNEREVGNRDREVQTFQLQNN